MFRVCVYGIHLSIYFHNALNSGLFRLLCFVLYSYLCVLCLLSLGSLSNFYHLIERRFFLKKTFPYSVLACNLTSGSVVCEGVKNVIETRLDRRHLIFLIFQGGQLAAVNLESRAALLAARQVIVFRR